MKKFIKPLLSILLVAILVIVGISIMPVSCEKQDADEVGPSQESKQGPAEAGSAADTGSSGGNIFAASANVTFNEDMEGTSPFATAYDSKSDLCCSYSLTYVTSPVFSGTRSAKFLLNDTDPLVSNSRRSEVTIVKGADGDITKNTWYSFAAYFPTAGFEYDDQQEVLCQWYQSGSPATAFRTKRDRFLLLTGNVLSPDNRKEIDLGPITKDTWHQWVFHFIHSYNSDGLIEVWHNGTKVLTHAGGNMYNDVLPKWKFGVYKSSFKDGTSSVHKRILYYDNVKVGNQYATYEEMAPVPSSTSSTTTTTTSPSTSTSTTTTPPTTTTTTPTSPTTSTTTGGQTVASFTMVNSVTDKDISTIANGSTYSLAAIGTTKINIKAITSPSTVGSVTFALSGAGSKSSTDSAIPYALYGDDGSGNYYSWAPVVGTYTLKATPYSDKYGKGTAGTPLTIKFTISK